MTPVRTRDGRQVQVTWTIGQMTDEKGDRLGFMGIGQDIVELKNPEEELKDRNRIMD